MASKKGRKDPWPSRTGEAGACFASEHIAPNPMEGPWSWRPGGAYDMPLLDADGHVYIVMRNVRIDVWRLDMWTSPRYFEFEGVVGTPVIAGGILYAVSMQGTAAAFDIKTGERLWKSKYCAELGQDPISVGVNGEVLAVPGQQDPRPADSQSPVLCDTVYGLYTKDGRKIWSYKPGLLMSGQNFTPGFIDDVVVFMNSKADVCCLKLKDGGEQWKATPKGVSRSTGGVIVGRNRVVYAAVNRPGKRLWNHPNGGKGSVRAYEVKTGSLKWERDFDLEAHSVPALLSTGPGGRQVLCVGLGATPGFPEGNSFGQPILGDTWEAMIVGLNPETGEQLWASDRSVHHSPSCYVAPMSAAQSKDMQINAVAGPVGAGDGTFFAVIQGTLFQAKVEDGKPFTGYPFNDGVQANPVVGPGVMVLAGATARVAVFRSKPTMVGKVVRPLDAPLSETGTEHFWAAKHGPDMANQGFTEKCKAPRSLLKPAAFWKWASLYSRKPRMPDDNLYNSPSVDCQRNTWIAANFSDIFVIRPDGTLRGSIYVGPLVCTPFLMGNAAYVVDGAGYAWSIDIETLNVNWRTKYCVSNPWDSWSAAGVEGSLIVGGNDDYRQNGAQFLFRLSTEDGRTIWKWQYPYEWVGAMPYNMIPTILDGTVVTANNKGFVYCHDLETGVVLWHTMDNGCGNVANFTTATATGGRNGLVANAWNRFTENNTWNHNQGGAGKLDVYVIKPDPSGLIPRDEYGGGPFQPKKWDCFYEGFEVNVAPLWLPPDVTEGSDGWQVVVCLGSNPGPPEDNHPPEDHICGDAWGGCMVAHDGETGKKIWTWSPPRSRHFTFRGSDAKDWFLPDAWTSVSSDKTGTIYGSFQDGVMYAVKGGELVSKFDMRSCANCAPGIAPGFMCTMNQHGLLIWRDKELEDEWIATGDKRAVGGKLPGGPIDEANACGGPWDDGRLEWLNPMPFAGNEKTTAVDVADHAAWVAETERLHKASWAEDLKWSEARKAELAEQFKESGSAVVWVVVGGAKQGGITVRKGENLKSDDLGRIATDAKIQEIKLVGDRLHYKKLEGEGPEEGWVSLSFKGTPLVKRQD